MHACVFWGGGGGGVIPEVLHMNLIEYAYRLINNQIVQICMQVVDLFSKGVSALWYPTARTLFLL